MSLVSDTTDLLDSQSVFWTDDQVYDALNDAMIKLWPDLGHDRYTETVVCTASQQFLDIPSGMMVARKLFAGSKEFPVVKVHDFLREQPSFLKWDNAAPQWFIDFDAETVMMVPTNDQTRYFKFEGVRYPATTITSTSTDITAIKPVKEAIMFEAASRIAFNAQPDMAAIWAHMRKEAVSRTQRRTRQGRQVSTTLRPGNARTHRLSGGVNMANPGLTIIGTDPYA